MISKEIIKLLIKNRFVQIKGGKGSYRKLQNPITKKTIIVPYNNKDLGKGLEKRILKDTGIIK
jgi:predicted RNA binding protein YcfA (HicA-like mRNA interferase family)